MNKIRNSIEWNNRPYYTTGIIEKKESNNKKKCTQNVAEKKSARPIWLNPTQRFNAMQKSHISVANTAKDRDRKRERERRESTIHTLGQQQPSYRQIRWHRFIITASTAKCKTDTVYNTLHEYDLLSCIEIWRLFFSSLVVVVIFVSLLALYWTIEQKTSQLIICSTYKKKTK